MKIMNKWMLGALMVGSLASCEMKDELVGSGASQAMGALELGVSVKESSRAGNDDVTTFPVSITSTANPANNKAFDSYAQIVAMNNVVELPVDDYIVSAHTPGELKGFSVMTEPYFKGEAELKVTEGITEKVNVTCTRANTEIQLNVPDDFNSFSSWTVTFDDGKNHTLEFSNDDEFTDHTAYWYLGEEGAATLTMNIVAVKDGITYTDSKAFTKSDAQEDYGDNDNPNFTGGDVLIVNIEAEENPNPDEPQLGFNVSVEIEFGDEEESVIIPVTPGTGDPIPTPPIEENSIVISDNGTGYLTNGVTVTGEPYPTDVAVEMSVPNGIQHVYVKIATTNEDFREMVSRMGLVDDLGMDLATEDAAELSELFAVPKRNATEYTFTMSETLFGLLGIYSGKHDFSLRVVDAEGNEASAVLTITI